MKPRYKVPLDASILIDKSCCQSTFQESKYHDEHGSSVRIDVFLKSSRYQGLEKCLHIETASKTLFWNVHEGICGKHEDCFGTSKKHVRHSEIWKSDDFKKLFLWSQILRFLRKTTRGISLQKILYTYCKDPFVFETNSSKIQKYPFARGVGGVLINFQYGGVSATTSLLDPKYWV